jgi:ABC-type multidrug transport system fused ATPase/permease subunit
VFGKLFDVFAKKTVSVDDNFSELTLCFYYLLAIAASDGLLKFFTNLFWYQIGSQVSVQIRQDLFHTMMRSEVTFFDTNPVGGILTLLSEDSQLVQDAFGAAKGKQLSGIGQFLCGIILAYVYSWRIALVATAIVPAMMIAFGIFIPPVVKRNKAKFTHISASMTIAEEALSAVRTVKTFNREEREINRFMSEVESGAHNEAVIGVLMACAMSVVMTVVWAGVVGNLYYGATLVVDGDITVGDMFSLMGFSLMGAFGFMFIVGTFEAEQKAVAAGARIIKLSEHVPKVPFEGGDIIEDFHGHIEFRAVSFKYPTRDVYVLHNVSFEVQPGTMVAVVGHSGSGKSTIVQLLERFYDIDEGQILLDGRDIKTLDPRWLHLKIGLVAQEPVLFEGTIRDNIRYGRHDATDAEVIAAAEVANAKKFIEKMADRYDQKVGGKGNTLSGGQRQRIAIARAVITDPVILITDEATSALDASSEKKVQLALDKLMVNRTAVVVAHRLSTIRNANQIYVFEDGEIKEHGSHDDLLALNGVYFQLIQRQLQTEGPKKDREHPSEVSEGTP